MKSSRVFIGKKQTKQKKIHERVILKKREKEKKNKKKKMKVNITIT